MQHRWVQMSLCVWHSSILTRYCSGVNPHSRPLRLASFTFPVFCSVYIWAGCSDVHILSLTYTFVPASSPDPRPNLDFELGLTGLKDPEISSQNVRPLFLSSQEASSTWVSQFRLDLSSLNPWDTCMITVLLLCVELPVTWLLQDVSS